MYMDMYVCRHVLLMRENGCDDLYYVAGRVLRWGLDAKIRDLETGYIQYMYTTSVRDLETGYIQYMYTTSVRDLETGYMQHQSGMRRLDKYTM